MITGHTLVTRDSKPENRGIANGVYSVSQSSGNITKILTTPLVVALSLSPVFLLGGVLAFISIIPAVIRKIEQS